MSFEIPTMHIEEATPEGIALQLMMNRDRLTSEQVVRRLLQEAGEKDSPPHPMIGLFSSDEDSALMDEVMAIVAEGRKSISSRETGF
jgi:hypothetical protein